MPGQFGRGDIRVSYYPISTGNYNISSSVTNNQLVTTKVRTIDGSGDDTLTTTYVSNHFHKYDDDGTTEGSLTKMNNVLATDPNSRVYGLHFMNAAISEDNTITIANAKVNGHTYESYELPQDAIDFTLKERGYINFFAGTYFSGNNSFFSLHKIERNSDGTIASIKEILEIYGNGNEPYYYKLQDKNGTITYESWEYYPSGNVKSHDIRTSSQGVPSGYSSVFNTNWIKQQSSLTSNAVYYFEVPVDQGEYALGSVNGGTGAYLMYLDIGAAGTALKPEGNAKLEDATFNDLNALHADAGIISYTVTGGTRDSEAKTYPTYYPLAWNNDTVATTVSSTNTGYVVGGAHTNSTPPGDIRVSRYDKDSRTGTSYSIWRSLNNGGTLNNGAVYTIVNGTQQTITNYGIGNQYTQNYGRVVNDMNDLLDGEDYVYGMHFMEAAISTANIVTVPKAVINETTYTDYQMPEDCIDFVTQGRGRITFFAGTFFSGSSVNCFFSLNKIFRDGSGNITDIKKITNIYGNGTSSKYVYKYSGDSNYYYSDSTTAMTALPIGYSEIFDLTTLSATRTLTQDAVYYFEIPVDAGEYALGSADGNGAYLLYLDIAANARFDIKTTITEVTETIINELVYPEGVAFVDAANSTAFDTDGKADPEKSVFLSIPITNSSGDTTFSITSAGAMTVTNTTSTLNGYESMSIPDGNSLTVNNGTPVTSSATVIVKEIVTEIDSDPNGSTITTVTTTTQTTVKGGTPTTTVEQTVTTTFGASSTTVTTSPAPAYDGHTLIPTDYTVTPNATADTIIEYTFTGRDLTNDVSRDGDLNIVLTGNTITVNGSTFTVCDVVKDGDTDAGTYEITISGTAGTYTVNVTKIDTDFVFTLNGAALSATGQRSVTVSP